MLRPVPQLCSFSPFNPPRFYPPRRRAERELPAEMANRGNRLPTVVLTNESEKSLPAAVRDTVDGMKAGMAPQTGRGGSKWMPVKGQDGYAVTIQGPFCKITRGVSTELRQASGEMSDTSPSVALHLGPAEEGGAAMEALLDALDAKALELVLKNIAGFEPDKKKQNLELIKSQFVAWSDPALRKHDERAQKSAEAGEPEPAKHLFFRSKIISRRDAHNKEPKNWIITVKEVNDAGATVPADAADLRRGNMVVQPIFEAATIIKSSKGYALDLQLREVLIVERLPLDAPAADDIGAHAANPALAALMRKRKAAAAEATATATKEAPAAKKPPPPALDDGDFSE